MKLNSRELKSIVETAIKEDLPGGDITTENLIPPIEKAKARIITNQNGVIAGLDVAREVFKKIDKTLKWRAKTRDGQFVKKGKVIAEIDGKVRSILAAERIALNFLQHLSGIATLTNKFVKKVRYAKIYDTRKTIPGLRALEKYAVACGGGFNHRSSLSDMVLIKDNHIMACKKIELPLQQLVENLRWKIPKNMEIEIEVKNLVELKRALKYENVNIIMLDNIPLKKLKKAVKMIRKARKDLQIEVSGNINLKNIEKLKNLKVDRISIGSITHSAPALDISLELV